MITFMISKDYSVNDNKKYTFAEFSVDSVDELPAADEAIDGKYLVAGSIALVIATGDFYVLNSEGEWINQTSEDENVSSKSNTLSLSAPKNSVEIESPSETTKADAFREESSNFDDIIKGEGVIKADEKDGEDDVLGDTESE